MKNKESNWSLAKAVRISELGNFCELCGEKLRFVIGHHVEPKINGLNNEWKNCQLRCQKCEKKEHVLNGGNSRKALEIQMKNNAFIALRLGQKDAGSFRS